MTVVAQGEHLRVTMRGIETSAHLTSTAYLGVFGSDAQPDAELFALTLWLVLTTWRRHERLRTPAYEPLRQAPPN
ncbi:hypothetical protein [Streptomyces inhibens]|uniref:hypothetical protein n=1 Tax=Streptomyces inhibens TaxID=2293571 RepID=UPI001EE6E542